MLPDGETESAVRLLTLLSDDELVALAKTVTVNQIQVSSRHDALRAIVTYSKTSQELLRRKKLKRDVLFQHLSKENVFVDPKADKMTIARAVLAHWGCSNPQSFELMEMDDSDICYEGGAGGDYEAPDLISVTQQANTSHEQHATVQQGLTDGQYPPDVVPNSAKDSWIAEFMDNGQTIQRIAQYDEMGSEFSKWFYRMLNSCHPHGEPSETTFSSQHFFPDADLKILLTNTNEVQHFLGAIAVYEKLAALVHTDNILFSPNVDVGGVIGYSTPHGLKVFLVCGTLHSDSNLVGLFAQQFGLVRNPDRNFNWTIKYSKLKLVAGRPSKMPTLENPGTVLPLS